jgi:multicomponent Na+:H+ antiporter subunit B
MHSLILKQATRLLAGMMLVFSVFLLFRGHNQPGGGFAGGLVAATSFALFSLAHGKSIREALFFEPSKIAFTGLALALGAGALPMLAGRPFLTGLWLPPVGGGKTALGLPLVFDAGVYLVVVGAVMTLVLALEREG